MHVPVVTGASRGIGRGVAAHLAGDGFRVFGTGRSIASANLPDSVVRIPCDHLRDEQTAAAFDRVESEAARIDVLVNSAWGGYEAMLENGVFTWRQPFWEGGGRKWSAMIDGGVRAALIASGHAARIMTTLRRGLIVNISYWAASGVHGMLFTGSRKPPPTSRAARVPNPSDASSRRSPATRKS